MAILTTGLTITSSYGSWYFGELPIRADDASVNQWMTDKAYGTAASYTADKGHWSNDGGRLINYYGTINIAPTGTTYASYWMNIYSYEPIITSITQS